MRFHALFALVLLAGCARDDKSATEEPTSTTTITSAPAPAPRPSDDELIRRVEAEVARDATLSLAARNVEFDVFDGIVTLRGSTDDMEAKDALERAAASVDGVETTLNKLHIRTPSDVESADTIAFSLQRSFVTDPALANDADRVSIEVDRGKVTLRGSSKTVEGRAAVERAARRTPGVVEVDNRITLEAPPGT